MGRAAEDVPRGLQRLPQRPDKGAMIPHDASFVQGMVAGKLAKNC